MQAAVDAVRDIQPFISTEATLDPKELLFHQLQQQLPSAIAV